MANGNGNGARRARFVEEYLVDLNATEAAKRAGYSERSAHVTGCRLLKDVKIREEIIEAKAARSSRTNITAEYVIDGLREATQKEKGSAKIRAYELLGKHLGLFTDVIRHEGDMPTLVWEIDAGKEV